MFDLHNQHIIGWRLREADYEEQVGKYLLRLDCHIRESFAPLQQLVESSLEGFDLHVMTIVDKGQDPTAENINGLIIFNQESNSFKALTGTSTLKINLHHVSSVCEEHFDFVFDQALEYIWKHTHCSAIRLTLYHIKDTEGKLKANPKMKILLKSRKFRWKTVINDNETGHRSEILEVQNSDF